MFAGGPPCQGFSSQRRDAHLDGDKRNDLVLEYIRLVVELQPRFFFFENVPSFGGKRGEKYRQVMEATLNKYAVQSCLVNSADYGVAQTRKRYIAVGRRRDQATSFRFPVPTVDKWRTVGEVIGKYPEPPQDYSVHIDYANHRRAKITPANVKRFSFVPQGGGWRDIPYKFRLDCHKTLRDGSWPDVYGRLRWDGQCPTITGGFADLAKGRYGHPLQDRSLTSREAASLQGFPDDFVFLGNRGDIRSQIGNAVPPPLAQAVGTEILRSLLCADGHL